MSLSDVVDSYQTGTYSVSRPTAGTRLKGKYTPSVRTTFPIDGSLQPAGPMKLTSIPQGVRGDQLKWMWTKTPLMTAGNSPYGFDVVTIPNELMVDEEWAVVEVSHFDVLDDFYKVTLGRLVSP